MIKSIEQAKAIQARRFVSGKKGVAKAVRHFMWKLWKSGQCNGHGPSTYGLEANFSGCAPFDPNKYKPKS